MQRLRKLLGDVHHRLIFLKRANAIRDAILPHLNAGLTLDVGSGNAFISAALHELRPDVRFVGIDVHPRPFTFIDDVLLFDGQAFPFGDQSFENIIIVDVLHHIDDPAPLMRECRRICTGNIIIKDHFCETSADYAALRVLDWFGNAPHGVRLPYNYFSRQSWEAFLKSIPLNEHHCQEAVEGMYIPPAQSFIGRGIQFVSVLRRD